MVVARALGIVTQTPSSQGEVYKFGEAETEAWLATGIPGRRPVTEGGYWPPDLQGPEGHLWMIPRDFRVTNRLLLGDGGGELCWPVPVT